MFAYTNACALLGSEAVPVRVEAQVERGLPRFTIVGLRDADAREIRERVRCGLQAAGIDLPLSRVTVSVAPADLPKAGAAFDLPVVLAVLAALGVVPAERVARVGSQAEVGLDGSLREVLGTLAAALTAHHSGWSEFIVPTTLAAGRAAHAGVAVIPAANITAVIDHLLGKHELEPAAPDLAPDSEQQCADLADVRGQGQAVKALEIAAAGGHNLLLYGPPGCGKTMLAQRLPSLLPELSGPEAVQVSTIHDAAGIASVGLARLRPFRAPHHSITTEGMIGGGSARSMVGELSLAHMGVLFLDELPEFRPSALDSLRQPLEQHSVILRRARWRVQYPARVQLVGAMNLCRCGQLGARTGAGCSCTSASRAAYAQRVSGAILSRFDLHVRLDVPEGSVMTLPASESSAGVRPRVERSWQLQRERWGRPVCNGHIRDERPERFDLGQAARRQLERISDRLNLSGRSQAALVRVARTVADLEQSTEIETPHLNLASSMTLRRSTTDD